MVFCLDWEGGILPVSGHFAGSRLLRPREACPRVSRQLLEFLSDVPDKNAWHARFPPDFVCSDQEEGPVALVKIVFLKAVP